MAKRKRAISSREVGEPISAENLAQRWGKSIRTLANWRSEGIGPRYTKIGRKVFYLTNDVKAYELKYRTGGER